MKSLLLILSLILPISAIQLKFGTLYNGWPESDSTLNGMIEISADSLKTAERLPIQAIYLVDISTECAGGVRQALIEGGKELIKSLRDNDRFGIIVYSKYSRTLLPLTNLNAATRTQATDLLERLTTEEGRDLSSALKRVTDEFRTRAGDNIDGRYLVMSSLGMISDGNKGTNTNTDLTLPGTVDSIGCIIHTINYGETFDDQAAILGAELNGGQTYLVQKDHSDSLVGMFKQIGAAITTPVYRNIELFVEIPESETKICEFGTATPMQNPIKIKQIAQGKTERIMFTLQNRPERSGTIDFDLDYYDLASKTNQNIKDNLKLNVTKEAIYNTSVAGMLIRGSILQHLAENILVLRRVDLEKSTRDGKDFRKNYASTFQQQVVNRLETLKSSVGSTEMAATIKLMQLRYESIRDGYISNEALIRVIKADFHQTLHGR